jgi:hypothetical protein
VVLAWVYRQAPSVILNFTKMYKIDRALLFSGKELTSSESKFIMEPYKAKELKLGW